MEYYHGNEVVDNDNQARMEEIAKFILNNFNKSTFDGEFDALFAVQSVSMLIRYYKIFKSLNPKIRIGAVFTYAANNSLDDEQTGMGTGQYAKRVWVRLMNCKQLWTIITICSALLLLQKTSVPTMMTSICA